ncbi:MAG: site-2 protease family protein [Nanoarchaeota archaeon]|nr:site-2 protease family protein [Nanoarchaeota archaeon]MBU1051437.1 site-2 protease family protein [Nanoarchaeota archaeon]MBU1988644.1 site-2 protease family protein [Nanoarchaeota archaeon]
MRFSHREKKDLLYAGLLISLAFAILLSGGYRALLSLNSSFLVIFFIAFLTAGLGFLLHEMMHKYVAQSYGYLAEFQAYYRGLYLALAFSFFGFIFAAPGAVVIRSYSHISRERNGKISLAGPLTNLVLAVLFLIPLLLVSNAGLLGALFSYGLTINSLLAAFNMIPVMPFDGAKIKDWSVGVYAITVIAAVGLFVLGLVL